MSYKTYSEKLRDSRWIAFRNQYLDYKSDEDRGLECDDCGEDTSAPLHVHHRLYRSGSDPWDYDFSEMRLFCSDCHKRIHEVEKRVRAVAISIAAHEAYEFEDFLDELEEAQKRGGIKVALARCKNVVRQLNYGA